MPKLFWTGKLSLPMAVLVNTNNLLAGLLGHNSKPREMTQRVKSAYNGVFSEHVKHYDELGLKYQLKAAASQLDEMDLKGKTVLDVGCGTGAIAFQALERGASRATCGDISTLMLEHAASRAASLSYGPERVSFQELDAQSLPYPDESFDVVLTGMTLGLVPDQRKAVSEMVRVCRRGGLVGVGAHGPEHYWEAVDACFRKVPKRYVLGYRLEFWPQSEKAVRRMMAGVGLQNLSFKRVVWRNQFPSGGDAFDFFAAISASFWFAKFPPAAIARTVDRTRRYFENRKIVQVTDDVIFGYGQKP